jgi:hypothetical protein
MNKLHVIAKVAFGMLGIYLIISVLTSVLSFGMMVVESFKTIQPWVMISIVGYGVLLFGYVWLVYYFLFRRADIFTRIIVGPEELPELPNPAGWYPFALRLAMMVAGFLFLSKSIWLLARTVQTVHYTFRSDTSGQIEMLCEQGGAFLIYLAISIYLLCGAPQFVRWQIKKTKQLYGSV